MSSNNRDYFRSDVIYEPFMGICELKWIRDLDLEPGLASWATRSQRREATLTLLLPVLPASGCIPDEFISTFLRWCGWDAAEDPGRQLPGITICHFMSRSPEWCLYWALLTALPSSSFLPTWTEAVILTCQVHLESSLETPLKSLTHWSLEQSPSFCLATYSPGALAVKMGNWKIVMLKIPN